MKKKLLLTIIFALILELVVFNINCFRNIIMKETLNLGSDDVTVNTSDVVSFDNGEILALEDTEVSISLEDIDIPVESIYLDLDVIGRTEDEESDELDLAYTVFWTDEEETEVGRYFCRNYHKGDYTGQWIMPHFKGKVDNIIFCFDLSKDSKINVNQIILNKRVPISFNILRLAIIWVILLLATSDEAVRLLLHRGEEHTDEFRGILDRISFENFIYAVTYIAIFLLELFLFLNSVPDGVRLSAADRNIYNGNLVEALEAGTTCLDSDIDLTKLNAASNPYDRIYRQNNLTKGQDYIWDTAYYDGHMYCYYGVVPAVLFFVPYHMITGDYLSTEIATFVAINIFIFFAIALFDDLVINILGKRYLTPITKLLFAFSIVGGTTLLQFITRPAWYELVYVWGVAFVAMGLYLIVHTMNTRYAIIGSILGGLCMAASVGCRPTMAIFSFFLIPYLWKLVKNVAGFEVTDSSVLTRETEARKLMAFAIPYILVAMALMYYNYIRFGNIAEFGQTYQLTVTNNARGTKDILSLPYLLWIGCFRPLVIEAEFPYIMFNSDPQEYAGWFYYQQNNFALFAISPILLVIFVKGLWKSYDRIQGRIKTIQLSLLMVAAWIALCFTFLSTGICWRYKLEGAIILVYVAFLLLANWIGNNDNISILRLIICLVLITFLLGFLSSLRNEWDLMYTNHRHTYYAIEHMLSFWR